MALAQRRSATMLANDGRLSAPLEPAGPSRILGNGLTLIGWRRRCGRRVYLRAAAPFQPPENQLLLRSGPQCRQ